MHAEILLKTGDAQGAMIEFQKALARTPRRAASLIGLARAAGKAGRMDDASKAAKEFLAVRHRADAGRPELEAAESIKK